MREKNFINEEGQVVLKRVSAPPAVDEKLWEEEGTVRDKNDALILCRKYVGQMMWLTTCTRPDIAACLGILASLTKEVKNHLVCLWRYLWTTKDHAMCTLPSPKAAQKIQKDECAEANPSGAQDGPQPCPSPLTVQTDCDASCAPGGGSSRSGILVLLVDQRTNRASLLLWQSRRQALTALSAPEAEVVALSEALMPAVVIHESCCDIAHKSAIWCFSENICVRPWSGTTHSMMCYIMPQTTQWWRFVDRTDSAARILVCSSFLGITSSQLESQPPAESGANSIVWNCAYDGGAS